MPPTPCEHLTSCPWRQGGRRSRLVCAVSFFPCVFDPLLVQAHGGPGWDLNLHREASFQTGQSPPFCLSVSSVSLKTWCLEQFEVPSKTERRHGDFPRGLPLQPRLLHCQHITCRRVVVTENPQQTRVLSWRGGGACSVGVDGCAVVHTSTPTSGGVVSLPWACRAPRLHVPPCPQPLETTRLSAASVRFPFQNVTELASHPMWPSQIGSCH